jgi:hypothetical protein
MINQSKLDITFGDNFKPEPADIIDFAIVSDIDNVLPFGIVKIKDD